MLNFYYEKAVIFLCEFAPAITGYELAIISSMLSMTYLIIYTVI